MVEQQNRVGQQLGNYRLERLLGRGGFAEVYLGQHLRLQRQAAIKVLHTYLSEKEVEDFQREAQIIAALDHPNIVRILDFDVQQGIPFLVMDYLPNGTLRQRHERGERLPLTMVVSYVKQIADALQYAHDQRLIHRDVKPENMLVGRRQEIVLSDFGIAAIAHSTSSMTAQASVGTVPYMAPEQIQAQARAASDQYALGIVTYEWLSGERPFEGSYTEIFAKHLMTPPPPLRQKLPALPTDVEQVILIALAKDPQQRFNNVQAFATALEKASQTTQRSAGAAFAETVYAPHPSPLPPTISTPPVAQTSTELTPPSAHISPIPAESSSVHPLSPPVVASPSAQSLPPTIDTPASAQSLPPTVATPPPVQAPPAKHEHKLSRRTLVIYRSHTGMVKSVAWSPDGKRIASGSSDNAVQVWDAINGGNICIYRRHTSTVDSVAWSPDGKRIASGSFNKIVQVWKAVNGGNVLTHYGHTKGVTSVAWSPDGKLIASGSRDATVQVWDATDGSNIYTYPGHFSWVSGIAWSPDGKLIASGSWDQTVQMWNATTGSNVFTYHGHTGEVTSVAWSPNGKLIASGGSDKTVQVWDATTGNNVFTYHGHNPYGVSSIAWSPDGKRIASGSNDKTVQVWDSTNGGNVFTYHGHTKGVTSVAWSPDGKYIVSGSLDKTVQVWEAK